MPATTANANALLLLLLNRIDAAGLATAAGPTDTVVSMHTADPGAAGGPTTSETTYIGYLPLTVVRSALGWTVSGNAATNAALLQWARCTSGAPQIITHVGISIGGVLRLRAPLASSIVVHAGITPEVAAGELDVTIPTT